MTSPFSFHCIVCVEEFDAEERFPVVLPCGHTYVCNECACRLDKCMECRISLSIMVSPPKPSQSVAGSASWASTRTGGRRAPSSPPSQPTRAPEQPPESRRLPLPKNIVLLSLMEATAALAVKELPSAVPCPIQQTRSMDDMEEENIRVGTSLAIGMCGTYIITKAEVAVYPSRPSKTEICTFHKRYRADVPDEEEVDSLVRYFHMDTITSETSLKRGDRVQIVSLEDGWAKLARGYGFIRAEAGQLVKVGASVDRSCRLEAILRSLAVRRRALKKEQMILDSQVVGLMGDLHSSLMTDDDLTVIGAKTFEKKEECIVERAVGAVPLEERDNSSSSRSLQDESPAVIIQPTENCLTRADSDAFVPGDTCQSIIGALSFGSISCGESMVCGSTSSVNFDDTRNVSSSHRRHTPYRDLTTLGIDFRTGLSGHMALTPSSVRPVENRNHSATPKMSAHSGLSLSKRPLLNILSLGSAGPVA